MLIYVVSIDCSISLKEIGKELGGFTVAGMSQIRKRLKEQMRKDNSLRIKYNQCNKALFNVTPYFIK
jgi:hypothetical protein